MTPGKLWKTRLVDGLGSPADDREGNVHMNVCTSCGGRQFLVVENGETHVFEDTDPPAQPEGQFSAGG